MIDLSIENVLYLLQQEDNPLPHRILVDVEMLERTAKRLAEAEKVIKPFAEAWTVLEGEEYAAAAEWMKGSDAYK